MSKHYTIHRIKSADTSAPEMVALIGADDVRVLSGRAMTTDSRDTLARLIRDEYHRAGEVCVEVCDVLVALEAWQPRVSPLIRMRDGRHVVRMEFDAHIDAAVTARVSKQMARQP